MDFFGDVNTACGFQTLNDYLQDRSYIHGHTLSQTDAEVFSDLSKIPESHFCHVLRWYNHIISLGVELKLISGESLTSTSVVKDTVITEDRTVKSSQDSIGDVQLASTIASQDTGSVNRVNDDDDDFDLFTSDEEDDEEAARIREELLKTYDEKRSQKSGPNA